MHSAAKTRHRSLPAAQSLKDLTVQELQTRLRASARRRSLDSATAGATAAAAAAAARAAAPPSYLQPAHARGGFPMSVCQCGPVSLGSGPPSVKTIISEIRKVDPAADQETDSGTDDDSDLQEQMLYLHRELVKMKLAFGHTMEYRRAVARAMVSCPKS